MTILHPRCSALTMIGGGDGVAPALSEGGELAATVAGMRITSRARPGRPPTASHARRCVGPSASAADPLTTRPFAQLSPDLPCHRPVPPAYSDIKFHQPPFFGLLVPANTGSASRSEQLTSEKWPRAG